MLYATVRQRKIYVKKPTTVIQNGVGVDELTLDMDAEWGSMDSIICVFTLKYTESTSTTETDSEGNTTTKITTETKEITKQMLHTYGTTLLVPWECLVKTGLLSVSCTGYVGSTKIMTTMLPDSFWNVVQNGAITGDETIDPTPTLYQQIVAAAGSATTAAAAANDAASEIKAAAAAGEYDGKTPTVRIGSTTTGATGSEAQVTNSGTSTDLVLNFTIPRGTQGIPGDAGATPSISIGKVETLEAGSAATVSMTGTTKNPVLNLGIPKGDAGTPGTAPTITATKSGKSTTLYADGKQIAEVKDGEDGAPGTDGTSVSISSISESTEDGGENVVTFNDGKTLSVKNGSKGSPGDDGFSPSAKVTKTDTGVKISITDKDGTTEQEVENGTCPEVGDDYELIETITLTEDVASVSRSVETDGTAYDFDGMKVCFRVPTASTANSGFVKVGFCGAYNNTKPSAYVRLRESTTGRISYASVEMRKKDGYWRAQMEEYFAGYSAPNISDRVNVQDHGKSYMHSWPVSDNPKLTGLTIEGNSSWVIPNGTIIYVYAIRHDGIAGSGDMLATDYDSDGAVKTAGGIAKYVAENAGTGSGDMKQSDYDADGAVKSAGGIVAYAASMVGVANGIAPLNASKKVPVANLPTSDSTSSSSTSTVATSKAVKDAYDLAKSASDKAGISVSGATVGQTVKISAVDESGVPTAWEAVDLASGGESWELVATLTATEIVNSLRVEFSACRAVHVQFQFAGVEDDLGMIYIVPNSSANPYTSESRSAASRVTTSSTAKRGYLLTDIDTRVGSVWTAKSYLLYRGDDAYGEITVDVLTNCDIGVYTNTLISMMSADYFTKGQRELSGGVQSITACGAGMNIGTTLKVWGIKK